MFPNSDMTAVKFCASEQTEALVLCDTNIAQCRHHCSVHCDFSHLSVGCDSRQQQNSKRHLTSLHPHKASDHYDSDISFAWMQHQRRSSAPSHPMFVGVLGLQASLHDTRVFKISSCCSAGLPTLVKPQARASCACSPKNMPLVTNGDE